MAGEIFDDLVDKDATADDDDDSTYNVVSHKLILKLQWVC